jgi:pimeloyl-ACP methyl ester carboxylesterase
VQGLTVSEGQTTLPGYRFFNLTYDQPADHRNPSGTRFQQSVTLLHRDVSAPMVLYGSGYFIFPGDGRTELTKMVNGNQLYIEHRFFGSSRPAPADWTTLTIGQAADDYHRLIQALKPIYGGKWLVTGGSKGGMAALFHRRFHPDDVDGTVAYSAPLNYAADSLDTPTNRYEVFLNNVGTDPACRQALRDAQRQILAQRSDMLPLLDALATAKSTSFTLVLNRDKALEFAVEEMPFLFWQYGSQADCANVPGMTATADDLFSFLDKTVDLYSYSDVDLTNFLPYYHQSATQLGYPIDEEDYFADLLLYPDQDQGPAYVPTTIPLPAYDPGAMVDIQNWVKTSGQRLLLLYGDRDPWAAGALDLGAATDSFKLVVPAGNHLAKLVDLVPADQATAVDAISRWSGVRAMIVPKSQKRVGGAEGPDPLDERARR